jgi:hypothetical protein
VATTDEVWRLDTEDDADCVFFQKMSDHGHYGKRKKGSSRQGTYVFTADGKFLSSVNDLDPEIVLATLKEGLAKWRALPESKRTTRKVVTQKPKHRWEDYYPHDGLVLTGYSRDLPKDKNPKSKRLPTWNRDAAWFSKGELQTLVPRDVRKGDSFDFPDVFVSRLSRLHIVDAVKGQTDEFESNETTGSKIAATVTERTATQIQMTIHGATKAKGKTPARGIETTVVGSATFEIKSGRFSKFDFVAIGERWGRTRFNGRRRHQEKSPIGFAFQLAKPGKLPLVTPGMTWAYHVPWMPQPDTK